MRVSGQGPCADHAREPGQGPCADHAREPSPSTSSPTEPRAFRFDFYGAGDPSREPRSEERDGTTPHTPQAHRDEDAREPCREVVLLGGGGGVASGEVVCIDWEKSSHFHLRVKRRADEGPEESMIPPKKVSLPSSPRSEGTMMRYP
jgi:hypothetical protein